MPTKRLRNTPEADLQKAIMAFVFAKQAEYPELQLLFHPANGGKRTPVEAAEFQKMGVRPGVSDLHLPIRNSWGSGKYIGLWIELKAGRGTASLEQIWWLQRMAAYQQRAVICRSLTDALTEIANYIGADWSHELNQLPPGVGAEVF